MTGGIERRCRDGGGACRLSAPRRICRGLRISRCEGDDDGAPTHAGGVHRDVEASPHLGDTDPLRIARPQVRGPREAEGDRVLPVGRIRDAELPRPSRLPHHHARSEERRVGKECRSKYGQYDIKINIMMPETYGVETCRELHQDDGTHEMMHTT